MKKVKKEQTDLDFAAQVTCHRNLGNGLIALGTHDSKIYIYDDFKGEFVLVAHCQSSGLVRDIFLFCDKDRSKAYLAVYLVTEKDGARHYKIA